MIAWIHLLTHNLTNMVNIKINMMKKVIKKGNPMVIQINNINKRDKDINHKKTMIKMNQNN